jgi:nitrous oxidase accessory protein NosD
LQTTGWTAFPFSDSSGNTIFHNNLNNTRQVSGDGSVNKWDLGYPTGGNYWSDYYGSHPNATEIDGSGIWNARYTNDSNVIDHYPLMNQITIPEAS